MGFTQTTMSRTMRIGEFQVRSIRTGRLRLRTPVPRRGLFSTVDPQGRIEIASRVLLAEGPGGSVVVDAGPGSRFDANERENWGIAESMDLAEALRRNSIDSGRIEHLVLTHLHPDHAGGAFVEEDRELRAALPAARAYLQRSNLALARLGGALDGYREAEVEGFERCDGVLLDGMVEIVPGIRTFVSDGHTIGMQGVVIESGGESLIMSGDLFPTVSHLRLPGTGEYDRDPERLAQERVECFDMALSKNAWLFLFHDSRHVAVRLAGTPERPTVCEAAWF